MQGPFQPLQKDNMLYKPLIGSEESGPLDVRGRSRVSKSLRFAGDIAGFNILSPPFLGPLAPGSWGQVVTPRVQLPPLLLCTTLTTLAAQGCCNKNRNE